MNKKKVIKDVMARYRGKGGPVDLTPKLTPDFKGGPYVSTSTPASPDIYQQKQPTPIQPKQPTPIQPTPSYKFPPVMLSPKTPPPDIYQQKQPTPIQPKQPTPIQPVVQGVTNPMDKWGRLPNKPTYRGDWMNGTGNINDPSRPALPKIMPTAPKRAILSNKIGKFNPV